MSFRSSITIVASPRPRVGKTLLARLLADFHLHEGRSVAAFDLNVGERTLAQFLPEKTTVATIRDINGQMVLFDRPVADENITKVIDLRHESFESFFSVAHQIGFVEEARRRSVAVAILFTVTPDDSDASAQRNVRTRAASRQVSAGQWKFRDGASTRIGAWSTQVHRNAAFLIRRFEYGQCRRHTAQRAYRAAALVTSNLFRVPGTRFTHFTGRFAGFDPAPLLNLFFGNRGGLGAFLSPDFPRSR
jgi:hypothetical protein